MGPILVFVLFLWIPREVRCSDDIVQCGSKSLALSAELTTPYSAEGHECHVPCMWMIESRPAESVLLTISSFKNYLKENFLAIWTLRERKVRLHSKYQETDPKTLSFLPGESLIIYLTCSGKIRLPVGFLKYKKVITNPDERKTGHQTFDLSEYNKPQCSDYMTSPEGKIFPLLNHEKDEIETPCMWMIEASKGERIFLNFLSLQQDIISKDHVSLWTWDRSSIHFQAIVSEKRRTYEFEKNKGVLIFLVAEPRKSTWGFHMYYEKAVKNGHVHETADASTFYETLYARKVFLQSEILQTPEIDHSLVYDGHMWMVVVEPKEEIHFQMLYTRSRPPTSNKVMIWALEKTNLQLVGTISFTENNRQTFILNRTVLIVFGTRDFAAYSRLTMEYAKILKTNQDYSTTSLVRDLSNTNMDQCGGTIATSEGRIRSPNYSQTYPGQISCLWLIPAQKDEEITILFRKISLSDSEYVALWVMDNDSLRPYGKYSTISDESHCFRAGESLFVSIELSKSKTDDGFVLEFHKASKSSGLKTKVG